jgi:hypothetical protein
MKGTVTIGALLAALILCLPPLALGEERVEARVRDHIYPGAGPGAYFDSLLVERDGGLPPELAALYRGGPFRRKAGRSPVPGGFVFDWHAGDLFSHRNIFQRIYGDSSTEGAGFAYRFGEGTELSAFGAVDARHGDPLTEGRTGERHAYGVGMATRASVLDLAIRYAEAKAEGTGGGVSPDPVLIPVRWRLVSAGVEADMGHLGLHAEGGRTWFDPEQAGPETVDPSDTYTQFLVGIDYTFENRLYLVLEYFQDGQAAAAERDGVPGEQKGLLTGSDGMVGRDNFLLGARYPLTDLTSIEFYNIVNDGEAALLVNPWLILSAGNHFSLKLSAQLPFSKTEAPLEDAAPAAYGSIHLNF